MDHFSFNWILVVGARPNFMKAAPLIRAIRKYNISIEGTDTAIHNVLVHTGQHYDSNMSDSFFQDLELPEPDLCLNIGSGTHGEQTGKILIEFEKVLFNIKPDLVIVVGDVNSTMACSIAAAKLHIPVAHVEAGLRSFDRSMPEEINRIVTDALSDYLFTPSPDGDENLAKEGISPDKIFLVGDIMVDSLLFNLEKAGKRNALVDRLCLKKPSSSGAYQLPETDSGFNPSVPQYPAHYALLTLHRPSNVDDKNSFEKIAMGLLEVSSMMPVIFPIHPRTRKRLHEFGMERYFEFHASLDLNPDDYYENGRLKNKIHCFEPLGYLDFISLMMHALMVLTDSGGIQEETTVLAVPCITLRDTTERPITLIQGTNVLVGNDPEKLVREVRAIMKGKTNKCLCPEIWDGHTAERIVNILVEKVKEKHKGD